MEAVCRACGSWALIRINSLLRCTRLSTAIRTQSPKLPEVAVTRCVTALRMQFDMQYSPVPSYRTRSVSRRYTHTGNTRRGYALHPPGSQVPCGRCASPSQRAYALLRTAVAATGVISRRTRGGPFAIAVDPSICAVVCAPNRSLCARVAQVASKEDEVAGRHVNFAAPDDQASAVLVERRQVCGWWKTEPGQPSKARDVTARRLLERMLTTGTHARGAHTYDTCHCP